MAFEEITVRRTAGKAQAWSVVDPQVGVAASELGRPSARAWRLVLTLNRAAYDALGLTGDGPEHLAILVGTQADRGKLRLRETADAHRVRGIRGDRVRVSAPLPPSLRPVATGLRIRPARIVQATAGLRCLEIDLPAELLAPYDPARSLMG